MKKMFLIIGIVFTTVVTNAQEFIPYNENHSIVLYNHPCDTFIMYSCKYYDQPVGFAITDENCKLLKMLEPINEKYGFEGFLQSKTNNDTYLIDFFIDRNDKDKYLIFDLCSYNLNRNEQKPLCFPEFHAWGYSDTYIDFTMYTNTKVEIKIEKWNGDYSLFPGGTEKFKTWDVEFNPLYIVERVSALNAVDKKGNATKIELAAEKFMMYALCGKVGVTLKDIRILKDNYVQWLNYLMGVKAPASYNSYPEIFYEMRERSISTFVLCYRNFESIEKVVTENINISDNRVIPYNPEIEREFKERLENIAWQFRYE